MTTLTNQKQPETQLSLFDSLCIVVGIIVGAGIYETSSTVAAQFPHWSMVLGIWLLGGILSFVGAICYAELASAYPKDGGDYVYLRRSYGEIISFLFAWSSIIIIRPGSIAAMAFPFANYAQKIWNPFFNTEYREYGAVIFATLAVLTLSIINSLNITFGKKTQNLLTVLKILGLFLIFSLPFLITPAITTPVKEIYETHLSLEGFGLALILVLFTFGGWSEIAFVAGEVKNPQRNLVRTLFWGTTIVTTIYILLNVSFFYAIGHKAMAESDAVATEAFRTVTLDHAALFIGVLICISTLGAIQGLIFTGARISYALGKDVKLFRSLASWNSNFGGPVVALWLQAIISIAVIILAGSFNQTLIYTTAVVWLFYGATGFSVIILRRKDPHRLRPYKAPAYPISILLFCASCLFLTYSALIYDIKGTLISIGIAISGIPIYMYSKRSANNE